MADRRRFNPLDTIPEVLGLYGLTIAVCTSLVADAERWGLPDALWWAVVTVSTTGYGDLSPHSLTGRVVAGLLMILAWVFNILLGAQLAAKLIVNSDAWTHSEQEETKTLLRKIAGQLERADG